MMIAQIIVYYWLCYVPLCITLLENNREIKYLEKKRKPKNREIQILSFLLFF